MRIPLVVLVTALCAACASQPATPIAPAPATAAKPAAAAAPAVAGATGSEVDKAKVPSGFKAKTRDGETVYCKKVAKTGSNFATETCMTAAEAQDLERKAESDRDQFRKNQTLCGTGGCGGT
jgi:hypothetical protein